MRPTPIPDDEVWPNARRVPFVTPHGAPGVEHLPVDVLVDETAAGVRMSARVMLDPGDLERLALGVPLWVSFYGDHLHPFDVGLTVDTGAALPDPETHP